MKGAARAWVCAVIACGGSDDAATVDAGTAVDAAPRAVFAPIDSDGSRLLDRQGRTVVLRGVNARVDGVFDVRFDDGRLPNEPIPELTPADCQRMAALGFNVLRLPINWSGIEPERDQFDEAYLLAVDAAIECAGNAGLVVIVDLHQDAYSKHIGEDGAPLWAVPVIIEGLVGGPMTAEDLYNRRRSAQVLQSFYAFFALGDPQGLQAEFVDMLGVVAARYADDDHVMGIEMGADPLRRQQTRVISA